jgi:hypothetical protein
MPRKINGKPHFEEASMGAHLISAAGAYSADVVSIEAYHGSEICPAPSISATGLKLIASKSPLHYWWQSALNPNRPAQDDKQQRSHQRRSFRSGPSRRTE